MKRDPSAYVEDFHQQYRHFQANLEVFKLKSSNRKDAKAFQGLVEFIAHVRVCVCVCVFPSLHLSPTLSISLHLSPSLYISLSISLSLSLCPSLSISLHVFIALQLSLSLHHPFSLSFTPLTHLPPHTHTLSFIYRLLPATEKSVLSSLNSSSTFSRTTTRPLNQTSVVLSLNLSSFLVTVS